MGIFLVRLGLGLRGFLLLWLPLAHQRLHIPVVIPCVWCGNGWGERCLFSSSFRSSLCRVLHRVTLHILVLPSLSQQYSAVSSHLTLFSLALGAEDEMDAITALIQPRSPTCSVFLGCGPLLPLRLLQLLWWTQLVTFPPQGGELCYFSCSFPSLSAVRLHLCPDSSHSCPSFTG